MKKTDLKTFREELLATGGYKTPAERRATVRHKSSGLVTTRFSFAVSRVFPLCALYEAFGRLNSDKWAKFCFSTVTMPESLGMNVELEGWGDRAKYKGPVVYLCNHMSTLETILLPPVLLTYGPFSVVAKASLAHLPFLEKAAAHMGLVGIGRKNPKADLLTLFEVGCKRISEGGSFLIFPQGTRNQVFEKRHFSSIGAKLAEKAGVPIVPLAVDSRCMPTREGGLLSKVFKDFGTVDTSKDIRLAAGPVIPCGKSRDMHEACFDWIATKLESWGLPTNRDK